MKFVVTGAGGALGRAFLAQVPNGSDVIALAHTDLDVGDHQAVMRTVVPLGPDVVLNFAAFTDVDACEGDRGRAYRDNALAAQSLALASRQVGAVLLHVSTDYIFDGTKVDPYDELDAPGPLSVYGRSKLAGETFVRRLMPEHFVVRTGYVFGRASGYASRALRQLASGETVGGIADRVGSPTFVVDLAAQILPLLLTGRFGTYHLAGPEATTWFDVLSRARAIGGFAGRVEPQAAGDLGLSAPRPRSSALGSVFTGPIGLEPLPPLDDALARFVRASA